MLASTGAYATVLSAGPSTCPRRARSMALQLRLQISGRLFRRGLFCHHSVDQLKSEIRSGASVKKVREAFQDSLSIAGFPPSSPPLLEMSGSDFRNVRVQGSISISSFDCTSALRAVDFNFDTRMDRCQAEMQSNSRFQFQLLKRPLSHRNAIETSISISALDFRSE